MDTQEIVKKIATLKAALEKTDDPTLKATYSKSLSKYEAMLKETEDKIEKTEVKAAAEEKKVIVDVEEQIRKTKKLIAIETDPATKEKLQKRLDKLTGKVEEVKEEIKEEKKEIAEQKKAIKEAIKEVKSAKPEVRKKAIKKVAEKKVERKKIETKKVKRKAVLTKVLSELEQLIEDNKKLKAMYGQRFKKGKKKGKVMGDLVDLERDAARPAKPFGYRFKGKRTEKPTAEQIERGLRRGTVYKESRPNRADVYPTRRAKLADGGDVEMEMGGDMFASGGGVKSLIKSSKRLDAEYNKKFQKGVNKGKRMASTIDLNRDEDRPAKPFGYRFKGERYDVPTEEQVKRGLRRGTVYSEKRANKADVYPARKRKL